MSEEDLRVKTRNALLTSTLDFEGVDGGSLGELSAPGAPSAVDEVDPLITSADTMPSRSRTSRTARGRTIGDAARQTKAPVAPPVRPLPKRTQSIKQKKQSEDRFTIYAATFVLLALIGITFSVYKFREASNENSAGLSYVELNQTLVNEEGLIARMKVNVQVEAGDEKWLQENKKALNDHFAAAATKLDLGTLRTPEGFNAAQEELRAGLNKTFHTDKIQAVLLTDLLVQNQRDQ